MTAFATALAFSWRPENDGQPYHIDPGDPGGGTAWAVTEGTWGDALHHGYVTGTLRDATKAQLAAVLRAMFWRPCQCDALPPGVGLQVFDFAVLGGPGRAARLFQRALGFQGADVDGDIGPETLLACHNRDAAPSVLIPQLAKVDAEWIEGLANFRLFGRGWERRVNDARTLALQLATVPA